MTLPHQKFREIVFQLLYSFNLGNAEKQAMLELMMAQLKVAKKHVHAAQEKVEKIFLFQNQIDPLIASASTSYSFDRIQNVTKNILRIGVFELFFDDSEEKIPAKIVIAEAIRLSRKFSTPESASFGNALLDHLYQKSLGNDSSKELLQKQAAVLVDSEVENQEKIFNALKDKVERHQNES